MVQTVKNLPAIGETRVLSLGQEDPLEEGMATPSSILAWRIPWTEEPGGLQFIRSQRVRHNQATFTYKLPLWLRQSRLPATQETWVQSLGWEDPLEEETATHSNILTWKIPWTEEPGGLQSMGSQKSQIQLRD